MTQTCSDGRVVIVDDHMLFAHTMELALSRQGFDASCLDMTEGEDSTDLVASIVEDPPDVLLLDLDLGDHGDGRQLIEPATRAGVDVVVVTGSEQHSDWARAIDAGAQVVLTKTRPLAELLETVRRVLSGETLMSRQDRDGMLTTWARHRAGHEQAWLRFDRLTFRESTILDLLIAGRSSRWIAKHLDITIGAASAAITAILDKLEVPSEPAAVRLARQIAWRVPFYG